MVLITFIEEVLYSLLHHKINAIHFCAAFGVRDLFVLPHETIVFSGDSYTRLVGSNALPELINYSMSPNVDEGVSRYSLVVTKDTTIAFTLRVTARKTGNYFTYIFCFKLKWQS